MHQQFIIESNTLNAVTLVSFQPIIAMTVVIVANKDNINILSNTEINTDACVNLYTLYNLIENNMDKPKVQIISHPVKKKK